MPESRRPVIYTGTGDSGTSGLLYGGRVRKDDVALSACGDVDEAQSVIGVARALCAEDNPRLAEILVLVARDLHVLMAELATAESNRHKLAAGTTLVTTEMAALLEERIDEVAELFDPPSVFIVPGADLISAQLDVARTVVRRAERSSLAASTAESHVGTYLNRLSDLLWTLARWQESTVSPAKAD